MSHRIVVGYDGSDASKAAIDVAAQLAKSGDDWEVVVVSGEDRPADWGGQTFKGIPVAMDDWLKDWRDEVAADMEEAVGRLRDADVAASSVCTQDPPADLMLDVAHEVDAQLIVVGASGAGGVRDIIMGSNTMKLLHRSDIPILVVPYKQATDTTGGRH